MIRKCLLFALVAAVPFLGVPAHADVATWHQGMTFASWWHDAFSRSTAITSLDQLANLKGDWIAVVPHWYMKDRYSTTIYPETTAGTATDDSVRNIIRQAHARGLKVMLKPHVDPRDGAWRGSITPSSASAWFSSYRSFMLHYARMAAETGVEMLCVGVEYKSMSGSNYTSYWRSVVADVRNAYKGPLTYAANWGPKSWGEYYLVQWWDAVDYIGIDAYFPITRANYPTVDQAKAGWYSYTDRNGQTNRWVDDMKALSQKLGKKVLFTEIGFNTVANPGAEWEIQTGTDQTGARNCTEATFQVFDREPWMAGIFWWTWSVDPNRGGSSDRGMDINNKPMAGTIASWFGRNPGDTSPPTTPGGVRAEGRNATTAAVWWLPSWDNVGVKGYKIYRDGKLLVTESKTYHYDTSLTAGRTVTYRVSAVDTAGNESPLSAALTATTPSSGDTQAPSTPGGTRAATVDSSKIVVWWLPSQDNVGVSGYNLYRNGLKVASVGITYHTDSGLSPGTTYSYTVTAFDAAGNESAHTPVVTCASAPAGALLGYDFEDGTQGWTHLGRCTGSWGTGSIKYQGSRAFAVYADAVTTTSYGYAKVQPSVTLRPGQTVTAQVYLNTANTNVRARAIAEDAAGIWTLGPWVTLRPWGWTRTAVTLPGSARTPMALLAIQFVTSGGSYTGEIQVDDVRW